MIIGPRFVWLHFPKCGGTEIAAVLKSRFGRVPGLAFDHDSRVWHHSIRERQHHDPGFSPEGKAVICGFRRLPTWLLSRVLFEHRRNPQHRVTRAMFREGSFYEASGTAYQADDYARKYADHPVTAWIRTEHLVEDFIAAFAPHLGFKPESIRLRFRQRNATTAPVTHDPGFWFTPEELRDLDDANPAWRELERRLYGATLADAVGSGRAEAADPN
jgi:hypothetical protein